LSPSQLVTPFPTFRERITLYSLTESADGYGGETVTEVSLGSAWAAVDKAVSSGTTAAGAEIFRAGGIVTEANILITMWYNASVTAKCIVKLGTRTFDIIDVNDIENKHQYTQLFCKERKA
jgi:SPP1 family predicted phage head-tail adaptor